MPLDPSLQRQRFSELADLMDEHLDIQALVQIAGSAKVRRGGGGGRGGSVALHSKLVWQPGMGWPMVQIAGDASGRPVHMSHVLIGSSQPAICRAACAACNCAL